MRRANPLWSLALVAVVPRTTLAQVTFTPGAELARQSPAAMGITFTPGPRSVLAASAGPSGVSDAPRPEPARSEPTVAASAPREAPRDGSALCPCDSSRSERPVVEPARRPVGRPAEGARETVATPSSRVEPAPVAAHVALPEVVTVPRAEPPAPSSAPSAGGACAISHGIEEIPLEDGTRAEREGPPRAMELSLSAWDGDVVALVTMARPGGPREGLLFSQSRLVTFDGDNPPTVARGPGFEPGAVVALGPDAGVYVLSPARFDVRNQRGPTELLLTVLDTRGALRSATRPLAGTRGMTVDSPPVAWRGGLAVVLGESTLGPDRVVGPVRERVFTFDREGAERASPWLLTEAQTPDSVGRFRVGLGRVSGGDALAAVYSDARGIHVRRFIGAAPTEPSVRIHPGRAWSPEVAPDGATVIFREDGYDGRPVRLLASRWDGGSPTELGQGWEPLATAVRGRTLVAGALVASDESPRGTALVTERRVGEARPRLLEAPRGSSARLDDAIDVAMAPTPDGALLAWLESTDRSRPDAPRRLAYARVRCP
jgi:hypothetical protein